jgi:hypothetical protein
MEETNKSIIVFGIVGLFYYVGILAQLIFMFVPITIFSWNLIMYTKLFFVMTILYYFFNKNEKFDNSLLFDIFFMVLLVYQHTKV